SIIEKTKYPLYEVVVVDNASTDGTCQGLEELRRRYGILVVRNALNLGFAKACNQGAAIAKGRYLVFLNNDTVVTDNWLGSMIEVMVKDSKVAIVGAKLLYPNDTLQHAGVVICDAPAPITPGHIYRGKPSDFGPANLDREYQAVTGACMMVRREVFDRVGGFDEGYVNDCEDVDLCFKVRLLGYRVIYSHKSVVYHYESISEGRFKHTMDNLRRLNRKWIGTIQPDFHHPLPKVSIVILNYNGAADTIECLKSMYGLQGDRTINFVEGLYYSSFQVIVVDNNSRENDRNVLLEWMGKANLTLHAIDPGSIRSQKQAFRQEIVLISCSENLGFSGGCNVGIRHALTCGADFVWLLNNDTITDSFSLWSNILFFMKEILNP
ncbi:MAG: glycosyltransferase family 2 protein, partial [Acetomicrobium sp.]|nr:glycosyltransferase family 2 protein [Acetomicrobium sp.]